jgi:hypothetical protein
VTTTSSSFFWRFPPCQDMGPSSPQSHRPLVRDQVAKPHANQWRGHPDIMKVPSSNLKCCTYILHDCVFSNLAESLHNSLRNQNDYAYIYNVKVPEIKPFGDDPPQSNLHSSDVTVRSLYFIQKNRNYMEA